MNKERLLILADFLDTVPEDRFDMRRWADAGFSDGKCGTRACALGWACTILEFQQLGLYLEEQYPDTTDRRFAPALDYHGDENYGGALPSFNDEENRTHAEILAVLDEAIATWEGS